MSEIMSASPGKLVSRHGEITARPPRLSDLTATCLFERSANGRNKTEDVTVRWFKESGKGTRNVMNLALLLGA
ncbi:hypothetical protein, partial [Rhizobium sp. R634]|uniref:hypothetical protein n=1 Tax=Rhizobium sp. R634 TaxID=1764274 RepID=UPI001AED07D6